MGDNRWFINGRDAGLPELFVRLAQARSEKVQHSKAIAKRDAVERRRERQEDLHLKRVGAAIRRAIREQERRQPGLIHVLAAPLASRRSSGVRCRMLETMARLRVPRPSHVGSDGLSSFHFRWTGRGLGKRRSNRSHRYRAGEAARHLRYICRLLAREIEGGGLVSNISRDPDHLAGFFAALEELEYQALDDSNVYISVVVALPHELSSDEREALLEQICSVPGGEGLPYVGVLHAPDPNGDDRNYHAHIMLSLRPAELMGENHYAFHVQKRSELNDGEFIARWRAETAEIMNSAMERAGHKRRFTPFSNAARGMAPRTKASGKSSPGAKHRERRQEQIDLFAAERAWRGELDAALQRVRREVATLLTHPRPHYAAVLATSIERMRTGLTAHRTHVLHVRESRDQLLAATSSKLSDAILTGRVRLKALAARFDQASAEFDARVARAQPQDVADADNQEAVAAAISGLAGRRFLPLEKIGNRLALTQAAVTTHDACRTVHRIEREPEVQAFFDEKWRSMLTELRVALEQAQQMPFIRRPQGYALDRKLVDTELYTAVRAAGDAPEVHEVLQAGIRDWLERQKREEQRKAEAAKKAAERRAKFETLIREIDGAGPDGRPWTREQEDTVVIPLRILARAAAEGRVLVCRDGIDFAMATSDPHLQKFAEMLDGTAEGRWALGRLADGVGSEVVRTASWAAFWSSGTPISSVENDRDDGLSAGHGRSVSGRGGDGRG